MSETKTSAGASAVTVRRVEREEMATVGAMAGALVRLHHAWDPPRFMLPDDLERGYTRYLTRELDDPDAIILVAEVNATLVGYAYGRITTRNWDELMDRAGKLVDLHVDPSARRAGAGRALVEAMVREFTTRGAPRVVLMTAAANEGGRALFARLGFRETMVEMTREIEAGTPRTG